MPLGPHFSRAWGDEPVPNVVFLPEDEPSGIRFGVAIGIRKGVETVVAIVHAEMESSLAWGVGLDEVPTFQSFAALERSRIEFDSFLDAEALRELVLVLGQGISGLSWSVGKLPQELRDPLASLTEPGAQVLGNPGKPQS